MILITSVANISNVTSSNNKGCREPIRHIIAISHMIIIIMIVIIVTIIAVSINIIANT